MGPLTTRLASGTPLVFRDRRPLHEPVVLLLPYPPTANHIWIRARKGMRRSEGYLNWLEEAGWIVKQQRPRKIDGHYSLLIEATRPDKRKRDIDNLIKPTNDLLAYIGLVQNDSYCVDARAKWVKGEKGIRVTVDQAEAA